MPATKLEPYLFFGGQCEEALEFYKQAIGAQVQMMMRFEESPEPAPADELAPGFEKKIMHASFTVGNHVIMASDGCEPGKGFQGFALSLNFPAEAELNETFARLAEGGKVELPLTKTFWSPRFGMLRDKFGVNWMLGIDAA